jgi:plasmid stability protein
MMPVTLSIKNAPDDVVQRLRERAARNHRSLQGELLSILESAVSLGRQKDVSEIVAEVRRLGFKAPDDSTAIIRADRDRDDRR